MHPYVSSNAYPAYPAIPPGLKVIVRDTKLTLNRGHIVETLVFIGRIGGVQTLTQLELHRISPLDESRESIRMV